MFNPLPAPLRFSNIKFHCHSCSGKIPVCLKGVSFSQNFSNSTSICHFSGTCFLLIQLFSNLASALDHSTSERFFCQRTSGSGRSRIYFPNLSRRLPLPLSS